MVFDRSRVVGTGVLVGCFQALLQISSFRGLENRHHLIENTL